MCCRIAAYLLIVPGVVLSGLAVASCSFVTRRGGTGMGLFRSEENIDFGQFADTTCVQNDIDTLLGDALPRLNLNWIYQWARLSGLLAPTFGGLATLLMLLDFCCNVCCSNILQTVLILFAQLNTAFMFLIYASNVCLASTDDDYRGLCFPSTGSFMAWAAFGLYFFGGFFVCCSPKPNPLLFRDGDDDEEGKGDGNDNGGASVDNKGGEAESGMPLAVAESASPQGEGQEMISVRDEEEPPPQPQSTLDPPTSSMVDAKVY